MLALSRQTLPALMAWAMTACSAGEPPAPVVKTQTNEQGCVRVRSTGPQDPAAIPVPIKQACVGPYLLELPQNYFYNQMGTEFDGSFALALEYPSLEPFKPGERSNLSVDVGIRTVTVTYDYIDRIDIRQAMRNSYSNMQVWARPGREMIANAGLDVSGRYKAYGQDLTITRGQLTWNYNPVSDPRINLRAERRIGDVTAGIDVTGRAMQPRAQVWSDPSMSQSEALGYLVLGRSLTGATSDQTQQVNAASAALSAGSGLLASKLGAKLGLDDAGVSQSRALGGSVIGVGKFISPKLYVGYGVSLVGSGSVLTLKYLLSRGFDIEVESSTVENRGSLNWRREK